MISVLCCSLSLQISLSSMRNQGVFQGLPCEVWTFCFTFAARFCFIFLPTLYSLTPLKCLAVATHTETCPTLIQNRDILHNSSQQYVEVFQNTTDGQKVKYWRESFLSNNMEKHTACRRQLFLTGM